MTKPSKTLALLAVGVSALAAGCGNKDTKTVTVPAASVAATSATPERSQTTKVVVTTAVRGKFSPQAIFAKDAPGVVTVISADLGGSAGKNSGGLGSGFVISGDGQIATNAHVVTSGEGTAIRQAGRVYVRFPDGNQVPARVVGFDPFADVALLKIGTAGLKLNPLRLGTTKGLQVGAPVAAIGSPFGEEQSLSVGIVSATDRSIDSLTGFSTSGAIQTDAAINHGNSGGPLLDSAGRVLGINSQIQSDSGDGSGVGFAVPVDVVRQSIEQLKATGKVHYAYLGVSSRALYPQLAEHFGLPTRTGVWVQEVVAGGPAAKAGIRAGKATSRFQEARWTKGGDVIVAVNNTPVVKDDDLANALLPHRPGQTVTLKVYRDGKLKSVQVKLGERPLSAPPRG